ncbi:MAG: phosphotransferase family protein [Myxococcota bacterium]
MAVLETGIQEVDPRHALDVGRLEAWVRRAIDEFEGSLTVRQFVGGQSNPTYLLSDGRGEWVLRRKPPGRLVSSAHATDREYRILSALGPSGFPVPRVRGYCTDESVIGTEFYLMDRVVGRIIPDQTLPGWTPDERRALYTSQLEILASLHRIDFEAIGLGDYGKRGNYFARQIHVWSSGTARRGLGRCEAMERRWRLPKAACGGHQQQSAAQQL